jgi:KDO2-lipid IV(A) lauroyltransferase
MLGDVLEAALVHGVAGAVTSMGWKRSLGVGARIGDLVRRLGIRRRVARANLEAVRPAWPADRIHTILVEHYRELGRVAVEYPRMPELAKAPLGEVVAEIVGLEHLESLRAAGRGALLMTGHFGNFELLGASLARLHPVDFVVRRLANPRVERWIQALRERAGVGTIATDARPRRIFESLRANHWVAVLADQDARRSGVFVPFMGRPASTSAGPARIAVASGAPIVMGFGVRLADGRHRVTVEPPLVPHGEEPDPVLDLTVRHVARLEEWVRRHPAQWLWLHRRWKTAPPQPAALTAA